MKAIMTLNGLLVVNKPSGLTSRKVVDRGEEWFPGVRIGHAGTLDPLATGVLVLCLGSATRLVEYVQRMRKTYRATVRLGARSNTDDAEGTITPVPDPPRPRLDELTSCLQTFIGEIDQTPPAHSAAHVGGKRAYDLARASEQVLLAPRRVQIYALKILHYEFPRLNIAVDCGKGTYIRSLARDLGERLKCGGLIEQLQRTRIGPFTIDESMELTADRETALRRLLPTKTAVSELPSVTLSSDDLRRLRQGRAVSVGKLSESSAEQREVAVFDIGGNLVGIATHHPHRAILSPHKMLTEC